MTAREQAMRMHPAGRSARSERHETRPVTSARHHSQGSARTAAAPLSRRQRRVWCPRMIGAQEGSLVTEYGLLAVVAATIAGAAMQWASGGALVSLFNALLSHARSLVGA